MKKLLWVIAGLLIVAVAALAVFIATFDADRYRPLLVSKLQEALGRPVTLQRVSLTWRGGLAADLQGLAVYDGPEATGEPLIQMDAADAAVRLLPLLRKEVQIASIVLQRPRIHASRDAQGRLNLTGLAAAASPAAAGRTASPAPSHVTFGIASFRVRDGTLHWTDAAIAPPAELWVKAIDATVQHISPGKPMDLDLTASLTGATADIHLTGRVTLPVSNQPGSIEDLKLALDRIDLEHSLPGGRPEEPRLRGLVTVKLQGSAKTLEPAELTRAVSGQGTMKWDQPAIANLNLLRAVFEKLSMIPGLVEKLETHLPPEYQAKLTARDTAFKPMELSAQVDAGVMRFGGLTVRTDTFALSGDGTVGLDGAILAQGVLRIEPRLSEAIIRSVNELSALANADGALEFPLTVEGQAPRLAVKPDLHYIASRVVTRKAVDLLGELLEKKRPPGGTEGGATRPESSTPEPSTGELLGRFLRRALEPSTPSDSSSKP